MTWKEDKGKERKWKELLGQDEDLLRGFVQKALQDILEAEMEEAGRCREGRAHGGPASPALAP
ncbi:MAG: hypothetical protein HY650_12620 [Acidobacteria bacterium]|nr:hypothetical protein [Acidobacteriota bacterium]